MKTRVAIALVIILSSILVLSCGGDEKPATAGDPTDMLVAGVDSLNLERSSEVRLFVGDSLWEYINGGAELYHTYDFVDVATAYYLQDSTEIVVDIYRFATPDDAYGMYTQLRPGRPGGLEYGIEGFGSPSNVVFVKGPYIAMFTGFESTDAVSRAVNIAAAYFANSLPGEASRPEAYEVFPDGNVVEGSDSKQAESFLGYVFMEDVYSQKYVFGEDTVTLFSTDDPAGAKFLSWRSEVGQEGLSDESLATLRYDDNMALQFEHTYYGQVLAGLTAGKLVGAIGYREDYADFMTAWIMSLKNPLE